MLTKALSDCCSLLPSESFIGSAQWSLIASFKNLELLAYNLIFCCWKCLKLIWDSCLPVSRLFLKKMKIPLNHIFQLLVFIRDGPYFLSMALIKQFVVCIWRRYWKRCFWKLGWCLHKWTSADILPISISVSISITYIAPSVFKTLHID